MIVSRLNRAIEVATIAHQNHFRKGTDIPYIAHPFGVGMLLAQAGCSEDVIVAGILHDTVEDTPLTLDDIRKQFGDRVAEIVGGCSEPDKSLAWRERKQHTIDHLKSASNEVKLTTCADKLYNVSSMLSDYAVYGETLWSRFNEGPNEQEWYFQSMAATLANDELESHSLVILFTETVQELFVEQRLKYRNAVQTSLRVGDDIEDDYCGWSSVWEPDISEDFFRKFLTPRDCAECENTEDCEDYDEEDPCGCSDIDLEAAVEHLREIAPHILWKIDTNGYDDCTEGLWQWSTISVPDEQIPVAERIIEQLEKGEDVASFKQIEDFYPYLYDEKKRLRQEISDLFKCIIDLRRFVYGDFQVHLSKCDSAAESPIRNLIKLLSNLFSAGKRITDISVNSDWPDSPDDDYFVYPFTNEMWEMYGSYAKKFSKTPEDLNPFEMIIKVCRDLTFVLDKFNGEGPQQIAEAIKYWQFEFSSSAGSGEYIRSVLMHLHDILENIEMKRVRIKQYESECNRAEGFWIAGARVFCIPVDSTEPVLKVETSWLNVLEIKFDTRFNADFGKYSNKFTADLSASELMELHNKFRHLADKGNNPEEMQEMRLLEDILENNSKKYSHYNVLVFEADMVS